MRGRSRSHRDAPDRIGAGGPGAIGQPSSIDTNPLAQPVPAEGVFPHLGWQGGPQRVAVEEVVEGRVGDRPGGLVVDGTAGRGGELGEVERWVGTFAAVVDQAAHHAVVASLRRRGDGQQQGAVALPGPRRDGLERVVGDDVELVDERQPCRLPGSAGSAMNTLSVRGSRRWSAKIWTRADGSLSSSTMRLAVRKMIRACRSSEATTRTWAPSTPSPRRPYSPMAAARVLFPLPAGMATSAWRGRGSSSTPRTISRCQGRSFMRRRAPVPLGTVTYRSMKAIARAPPRRGRRRRLSGGAVT